jgi:hypothetical protein
MSGFMVQGWARTKDGHFTSKCGRMGIIKPLVFKTGDFGWKIGIQPLEMASQSTND